MLPETRTRLEQRAFLRGRQEFEIRADGDLEVVLKRLFAYNRYRVPLWHINPKPVHVKYLQVGSLVGAILFGAGMLVVLGVMIFARSPDIKFGMIFPLIFFGLLFWACFWKLQTQSINANFFYHRDGSGRLSIWLNKPDEKKFQDFCEALSKKAEEAWNHRPLNPETQSLAGELAALKKLKDNGVLTEAEFERAKAKLLDQAEQKRIGFG